MEFDGHEILLTHEEAIAHKDTEKLNQQLLLKKACECYHAKDWKLGSVYCLFFCYLHKFSCHFRSFV